MTASIDGRESSVSLQYPIKTQNNNPIEKPKNGRSGGMNSKDMASQNTFHGPKELSLGINKINLIQENTSTAAPEGNHSDHRSKSAPLSEPTRKRPNWFLRGLRALGNRCSSIALSIRGWCSSRMATLKGWFGAGQKGSEAPNPQIQTRTSKPSITGSGSEAPILTSSPKITAPVVDQNDLGAFGRGAMSTNECIQFLNSLDTETLPPEIKSDILKSATFENLKFQCTDSYEQFMEQTNDNPYRISDYTISLFRALSAFDADISKYMDAMGIAHTHSNKNNTDNSILTNDDFDLFDKEHINILVDDQQIDEKNKSNQDPVSHIDYDPTPEPSYIPENISKDNIPSKHNIISQDNIILTDKQYIEDRKAFLDGIETILDGDDLGQPNLEAVISPKVKNEKIDKTQYYNDEKSDYETDRDEDDSYNDNSLLIYSQIVSNNSPVNDRKQMFLKGNMPMTEQVNYIYEVYKRNDTNELDDIMNSESFNSISKAMHEKIFSYTSLITSESSILEPLSGQERYDIDTFAIFDKGIRDRRDALLEFEKNTNRHLEFDDVVNRYRGD